MLKPKQQVAALPWRRKKDRIEFLLVTSRETRRWVIPKGWPMEHLADYNAARLEAFEEAGVKGHMKKTSIGIYRYDKRMKDGSLIPCLVHVHAMEVTSVEKRWPEKNQRERAWFAASDAVWHVDEPGLKDIIVQFSK